MSEPLPKLVDIRKLIAAGTELRASEPLQNFKRLRDMLESDAGNVDLVLHCFIDQGKRRIDGTVQAQVSVTCQRCLQPMPFAIDSQFSVAVVWSDEDAERLPKHLDPYIVGEGLQDIRGLIEDELIISLPYASYHEINECTAAQYLSAAADKEQVVDAGNEEPARRENPFKVLEQLKPGK